MPSWIGNLLVISPPLGTFGMGIHSNNAQDMKHCDLSPFNILLHALMDHQKIFINLPNFGLACRWHDHQQPSNWSQCSNTLFGMKNGRIYTKRQRQIWPQTHEWCQNFGSTINRLIANHGTCFKCFSQLTNLPTSFGEAT